jgi:hypothetical protein
MSIKIKLNEDQVLVVRADPEQWAKAYKSAIETNDVIEVRDDDGRVLAIPSSQILFWEEVPDDPEPEAARPDRQQPQLA